MDHWVPICHSHPTVRTGTGQRRVSGQGMSRPVWVPLYHPHLPLPFRGFGAYDLEMAQRPGVEPSGTRRPGRAGGQKRLPLQP